MAQFDLSTYSSQIFWLLICFATLIGLMLSYFLPRFYKILNNRENKTQKNLEQLESLKTQINNLALKREQELQQVHIHLETLLDDTIKSIEQKYEIQKQQIDEEINITRRKMQEDFEAQKLKIIKNIQPFLKECVEGTLKKFMNTND